MRARKKKDDGSIVDTGCRYGLGSIGRAGGWLREIFWLCGKGL